MARPMGGIAIDRYTRADGVTANTYLLDRPGLGRDAAIVVTQIGPDDVECFRTELTTEPGADLRAEIEACVDDARASADAWTR